jgi:hypothetical protein
MSDDESVIPVSWREAVKTESTPVEANQSMGEDIKVIDLLQIHATSEGEELSSYFLNDPFHQQVVRFVNVI